MKSQKIERRENCFSSLYKLLSDSSFTKCQAASSFLASFLCGQLSSSVGCGELGIRLSTGVILAQRFAERSPLHGFPSPAHHHWDHPFSRATYRWALRQELRQLLTNIHSGFVWSCSCGRLFGLAASIRDIFRNQPNTKDSHCNINRQPLYILHLRTVLNT